MKIDLSNKNALVCGSSQGIGRAVALQLAQSNANVTLLARNKENLERVMNQLPNNGKQNHNFICSDIGESSIITDELKKMDRPFHILINNTGGPPPGLLQKADAQSLIDAFKNHVVASQLITQLLTEGMKKEKFGRIINIISVGLKQPIANLGVSNTIRGAMGSWAKTLASELGEYGITVNNILPGYTNTERLNELFENISKKDNIPPEQVKNGIIQNVPAKRLAEPKEIAYIATFLASELAGYINGINLPVDGGYLRTL